MHTQLTTELTSKTATLSHVYQQQPAGAWNDGTRRDTMRHVIKQHQSLVGRRQRLVRALVLEWQLRVGSQCGSVHQLRQRLAAV